ncbi:MAG: hypothetical protein ACK55Z_00120, partial [bacterium]
LDAALLKFDAAMVEQNDGIDRTESDEKREMEPQMMMQMLLEHQQLLAMEKKQQELRAISEKVVMPKSFKGPAKRSDSRPSFGIARSEPSLSDSRPSSGVARSEPSPAETLGEARELKGLETLLARIKDNEAQIAVQQERMMSMKVSLDASTQHAEAMTIEMVKQKSELARLRLVEASEVELLRQFKAVESEQRTAAEQKT